MDTPSSKRHKYGDYLNPVIDSNAPTPVISPNPFSKYGAFLNPVVNSNAPTPNISPAPNNNNNNQTPVVSRDEYLQGKLREIKNMFDEPSNNLLGDLNRESNKRKRAGGRKRSTTQKRKQNNKKKSKKTKKTNTKSYWK